MPRATTIQDVLLQLDDIIAESIATNNRLGLFAYIYRRTTAEVASEIQLGGFHDNRRMELLDVEFANLYFDAYNAYKSGQKVSAAWAFAFDQAKEPLTILQHILLGMNAHINLDLGVATAKTMWGQEIRDIEADFNKVNDILYKITNELQTRLNRVSPLMFVLDIVGMNSDEMMIDFIMRHARGQSWNSANVLWALGDEYDDDTINNIDHLVLEISKGIKSPKARMIRFLLRIMHRLETKKVSTILLKIRSD